MSVGVTDRAAGQTDRKDEKCPGENVSLLTAAFTGPRRWAQLSHPLVDELSSGEACNSLRAERSSGDTVAYMRLMGWGGEVGSCMCIYTHLCQDKCRHLCIHMCVPHVCETQRRP